MRVRAKTLKRLAGAVWLLVGLGLSIAGVRFVFGLYPGAGPRSALGVATSLSLGALVGVLKGHYVLSRTAKRNIRRIRRLNDPRAWQVFTGNFLILIVIMMLAGRLLRELAANGWLGGFVGVGGLYLGIGSALVVASWAYFAPPRAPLATRLDGPPTVPASPQSNDAQQAADGLLLVNLGSPSAPTSRAVRAFLRQFLGDPHVVDANRVLWAFVLNVIILPFRSGQSAALYRSIWTREGSPLIVYGRALREQLERRLPESCKVGLAMRYGEPSLEVGLRELLDAGCSSILVVPLFPQYSDTTTGSIVDEVRRILPALRSVADVRVLPSFPDDEAYIEALAQLAERYDAGDFTVFSFHGIPEAYVEKGDPYLTECGRTAWRLAERLGLERDEWEMVFQSQFGVEPWLQPYLDEFVPSLARTKPRLRVIAPSFAADCLETLEEIGERLVEDFEAAGGEELIVVPSLNAEPAWVEALEGFAQRGGRPLTRAT